MTVPGFTAATSLRRSSARYHTVAGFKAMTGDSRIAPQMRIVEGFDKTNDCNDLYCHCTDADDCRECVRQGCCSPFFEHCTPDGRGKGGLDCLRTC